MRRRNRRTNTHLGMPASVLNFELLEDRRVLATLTVTDVGDTDQLGTLRHAINVADEGDTIVFDELLAGATIELVNGELTITRPLTIDGSGLASRITIDASGNDPTPDIDDGAGSRVFHIDLGVGNSEAPVVILRNMQLTGGDVEGSGGAIFARRFVEFAGLAIEDNFATLDGGGIFVAAQEGSDAPIHLRSTDIVNNRAGRNGGGIATELAFFDQTDSIRIIDNVAAGDGGGIYHAGRLSLIQQAEISGNVAVRGGGVFLATSSLEGPFFIRHSTIAANSAGAEGGGIATDDVSLSLRATTVSSNQAGTVGGGLWIRDVQVQLNYVTVVSNISNGGLTYPEPAGGGIYVAGTNGLGVLTASVIANNQRQTAGGENVDDDLEGDTFASLSLIESSSELSELAGDGNLLGIDPDLGQLTDNGGFAPTHLPAPTSPVIDAGGPPPEDMNQPLEGTTDQRGLPRSVDGNADGLVLVDMGAVERQDANERPAVDAGEDVATRSHVPIQLTGTATGEFANAPVTVLWEVVSGSDGASFDDASSTTPTFTAVTAGTYQLRLTATDGSGSAADDVIVTVTNNQAPLAKVSVDSLVTSLRFPLELNGQLSLDPDMDALDYLWSMVASPAGSQFEFSDAASSITQLTADTPGDYTIQLIVDDGMAMSEPFEFTVTFEETIQAGGPYQLIAGNDLQLFGPTRFVSAPDGIGQVTWDLDGDGFYDDAQGNAPLIPWSTLESMLGPDPTGIFPISAENFIGAGNFSRHESMLTILPAGSAQLTDDQGAFGLTGDIDGDGDVDAVGSAGTSGPLIAFFNDGNGNFTPMPMDQALSLAQPSVLTDADQDGDLDLIITPRVKPTTLLFNDGTGQFIPVSEFATQNSSYGQVHVDDLNDDQFPDVFVADTNGVQLYSNDGLGNLIYERTLFTTHPDLDVELGEIRDLVFADFDGDALIDVLIERVDGSKDFWWGQAGGDFEWSPSGLSGLPSLEELLDTPADLDGDLDLDWIGRDGRIFRQDASGRFFHVDDVSSMLEVRSVADINQDGHIDVIAELMPNAELQVFLNDGLGTFSESFPLDITLEDSGDPFLVEDFDGQGQLDLLKPDINGAEIWNNETVPQSWHNFSFAVDVNNSGEVSPIDPLLIINELNDRLYSTQGAGILAIAPTGVTEFVDVNDDGFASPTDALLAINALTDAESGPLLDALPDVTMRAGSPLAIALNGNALEGVNLTFSATSSRPIVSTWIPEGNRSLVMDVRSVGNDILGQMTFQLFENYVPRVTDRMIELAQSGFYDGLTFHRILDDFVIQGGDPNGDGTGNSSMPDFDDQFHPHLQHNQTGVLSMAKSHDDSNNSQFFITEGESRHLDFNHSIFGFLVEGESTRQAVSNVPANPAGRPTHPVLMENVDVVIDSENRVLFLDAPEGFAGTAQITVTATVEGGSISRSFEVTVIDDNVNSSPYLEDIPPIVTPVDASVTYQLPATDVEDDAIVFFGPEDLTSNFTFPVQQPPSDVMTFVDATTGLLTITPQNGYTGTFEMTVAVSASTFRPEDFQTISVTVG